MRRTFVLTRRSAIGGAAALALAERTPRASAQTLDTVSFATNWRAEAEHGGFYQAIASGLYARHGIHCDLRVGGPQLNPAQLLVAGRVDAIMSNSLQALSYAGEKLPFLCVAALMQKDPQGLMVHAGQGDDSFEALRGRPIMVGAGGRIGFWPWLRATFGYTDEQIRPYTFSVAPFLHDPRAVQQAFVTAEPFTARGASAQTGFLLFADRGFDNYQTTIDTSAKTVANRGEVLQRFVDATIEGWALYMRGTDRAAAHALIQRDNPDMPAEALAYADTAMAERGIVESGDAVTLGIGAMTQARWTRFGADMVRAGLFPAGLDVARAYSLQFVNRKIGL